MWLVEGLNDNLAAARFARVGVSFRDFEHGGTPWDDGYESALLHCADQLEATVREAVPSVPAETPEKE